MKTKVLKQNNVTRKYGEQEKKERDWILFTKHRAVLEHRRMWKWIAHTIAVDKENMYSDILDYKHEYIDKMISLNLNLKDACETTEQKEFYEEKIAYYRQTRVFANCFCCMFQQKYSNHVQQFEFIRNRSYEACVQICPVIWENKSISEKETGITCAESLYGIIINKAHHKEWKKCCKLAYKIAMLPERDIEAYV